MKRTIFLLVLLVAGCGEPPPNLEKAEAAVKVSLDVWKADGKPNQLPSIEIADPDWKAGYRLLDYTWKTTSAQPQQGPRVVVTLQLQSRGKTSNKEVAYEVILGDPVKIGRDAFHVE